VVAWALLMLLSSAGPTAGQYGPGVPSHGPGIPVATYPRVAATPRPDHHPEPEPSPATKNPDDDVPSPGVIRMACTFGGGAPRAWQGAIEIRHGTISELVPLGIDAQCPGAVHLEGNKVLFRQDRPRTFDGFQITIDPDDPHQLDQTRLWMRWSTDKENGPEPVSANSADPQTIPSMSDRFGKEIALSHLVRESVIYPLDSQGNQLVLRRLPGDDLWIRTGRDHLVFAPNALFLFEAMPHISLYGPSTSEKVTGDSQSLRLLRDGIQLHCTLRKARGGPVVHEETFDLSRRQIPLPPQPVSMEMPDEEGVYEVIVALRKRLPFARQPLRASMGWKQRHDVLAERMFQCVVVAEQEPTPRPVGVDLRGELVERIDTTNRQWWKRFAGKANVERIVPKMPEWKVPQMPDWENMPVPRMKNLPERIGEMANPTNQWQQWKKLWQGPLSSGHLTTYDSPLAKMASLPADADHPPWEAYTLPIKNPGKPHLLEIEYPGDLPQTFGVSILEPNTAGGLLPISIDSGVDVPESILGHRETAGMQIHRMLFWPKSEAPIILITNQRDDRRCVFGKIRLYRSPDRLPKAFQHPPRRLFCAYMHRPYLAENFSAEKVPSLQGPIGAHDWQTFYQAATRMTDYLDCHGYGGLMLSVMADGSTLYPSELVRPTPRYDSGAFARQGEDPVRKDVVELVARLFDRRGLALICALDFSSPLPELEAEISHSGDPWPSERGLRWIGPEGESLSDRTSSTSGRAAYYNLLHPRVQEAMLRVARECLRRYAHHRSFHGLAIQLSPDGYAQLPPPSWGMDDVTIARFQRDTGIRLAAEGPRRFSQRADALLNEYRHEWLRWRARELYGFYRRLQAVLAQHRDDANLYLAGANMFEGELLQRLLAPSLPRKINFSEAMLYLGFDLSLFRDRKLVLLHPERVAPMWSLAEASTRLEMDQMGVGTAFARNVAYPGSLFFHLPKESRLTTFEEQSPYRPVLAFLSTQAVPSGMQNRRRFMNHLARDDCRIFFDGSRLLPMGQENAHGEWLAGYRRLPDVPFETIHPGESRHESIQPLTLRQARHDGKTWIYLINDAPYSTSARLTFQVREKCRLEELSGTRAVDPPRRHGHQLSWQVSLKPYDLVAVSLSDPRATVLNLEVGLPEEFCAAGGRLNRKLIEFAERVAASRVGIAHEGLHNGDFEYIVMESSESKSENQLIPGWNLHGDPACRAALDREHRHEGLSSLLLSSDGPSGGVFSDPFPPTETGRLFISAWLGIPEEANALPLQLVLQGSHRGKPMVRTAAIGPTILQRCRETEPVEGVRWHPVVVPLDDLPLNGLSDLRLRFDLRGPGKVWIDQMKLYRLAFTDAERTELMRLISVANLRFYKNRVSDSLELLEGYWPRLLSKYIPAPQNTLAQQKIGHQSEEGETSSGGSEGNSSKKKREKEKVGFWGRMGGWVPDSWRF
jgi:hypothetical protein